MSLAYVFYASALEPVVGQQSLTANAAIVTLALIYYAFVHRRRGSWTIRNPEEEGTRSQ